MAECGAYLPAATLCVATRGASQPPLLLGTQEPRLPLADFHRMQAFPAPGFPAPPQPPMAWPGQPGPSSSQPPAEELDPDALLEEKVRVQRTLRIALCAWRAAIQTCAVVQ